METNDYKTLLNVLKTRFIANLQGTQQEVTDLNEGSNVMTIFESIASILEQAYIDTRLGFQSNLNAIATSIFEFSKKEGQAATVNVVFSRAVPLPTAVTIPSGTIVSDGTHNFTTSKIAIIPENELNSNSVSAQADSIGSDYNVGAEKINTIVSSISSQVVAVTNPIRANGGADNESNADMLARFKRYINGLQGTNRYGIESGLLANPKVRSVSIVENFTGGSPYNISIFVDDGTGNLTDNLKRELEDIVNGTNTSTNPGLRAAGINAQILPCTQISIDIEADITIYRVEESYADYQLKETLNSLINGLKVNEDVLVADVVTALKQTGNYIKNVKNLKLNNLENTDVFVAENQIARLGNISLHYSNWE